MEIKVSGSHRLPAPAVIAASGLHKGQMATRAQLDAAAQRLADTGLFASVSYQYDPKTTAGVTGYALTLLIGEQTTLASVELDFPGQDTDKLWQQLKAADPLIDKQMPDNDRATAYYKKALDAAFRKSNHPEEIVTKTEADLGSGRTSVAFRPAHLPTVALIRFQGNSTAPENKLQAAMAKVSLGQEYSERDFRRKLELNLRPLYEELGCLTVKFTNVTMAPSGEAGVTVTTAIDEGPVWRLGQVDLTGDRLPLADMHDAVQFERGSTANWKLFTLSVAKLTKILRRDGYIAATYEPERSFHPETQVVDVNVAFTKGKQYLFGEVHMEGLDPDTLARFASLWKLPSGAPMNQPYIDEFILSAPPNLRRAFRSFSSELAVRPASNIVDVNLKFH